VVLGILVLWLAAGQAQANPKVYDRTLRSTGWVVIPQAQNKLQMGTCWVVDRQRKLVVTNHHVVGSAREVSIYFPAWHKGKVIYESAYYLRNGNHIRGNVIATDRPRDLALVQLASLPSWAPELPLAPRRPKADEAVLSVGNSSVGKSVSTGRLWKYSPGKVVGVFFGPLKTDMGPREACWLEIRSASTHGDSGGPLVNLQGQLVGVIAQLKKDQGGRVLAVDLEEVKDFLARNRPVRSRAKPASPLQGTWKVTCKKNGKDAVLSMSCRADGGFEMIGAKTIVGRYSYRAGRLNLTTSDGTLRDEGDVTWVGSSQFRVTFGTHQFVFRRR
jgi:hypothetical protein